MKVLLAGASGAIGIPITRQLIAHGHQVLGLTRDRGGAGRLEALGARPVVADALDRDALVRTIEGLSADAVIHELTALRKPPRRHSGMALTNRLRSQGTANLLARRGLPVARGGVLGWIHHEDAAAATVAALERGRPGQAYSLVDDLPVTWEEVYTAMAEAFGAPPPRRLPRWLFRLAASYVASFAFDTSMRVSNAKAMAELGWRPAYRTYRDGIGAAAGKEVQWRSHGRSGAGTRSA
jgi:nucleoside-diphosphate-sugar epimerase